MNTEIFFTLAEYKSNFERLKKEFVDSYIDNDEEEFIAIQTEWYQRCIKNTILEHGILGDSVGWDTNAMFTGKGFVAAVDEKVRGEMGGLRLEVAQNLNVSFGKIIKFLQLQGEENKKIKADKITPTQWALYFFILQECKIKPRFKEKIKEIEALSKKRKINPKNFQLSYNEISKYKGLEGYAEKDTIVVERLLRKYHEAAIPEFGKLTKNIF